MKELVTIDAQHEHIFMSVIVIVSYSNADSVAKACHSCLFGYIGKGSVAVVSIESIPISSILLLKLGQGSPIYAVDIGPAIAVIVNDPEPPYQGLRLIHVSGRSRTKLEVQSVCRCTVFHPDGRRGANRPSPRVQDVCPGKSRASNQKIAPINGHLDSRSRRFPVMTWLTWMLQQKRASLRLRGQAFVAHSQASHGARPSYPDSQQPTPEQGNAVFLQDGPSVRMPRPVVLSPSRLQGQLLRVASGAQ